jgi:hypothetical protein
MRSYPGVCEDNEFNQTKAYRDKLKDMAGSNYRKTMRNCVQGNCPKEKTCKFVREH